MQRNNQIITVSSFEVLLPDEYQNVMLFYKEYSDLLELIRSGDRWIDNG